MLNFVYIVGGGTFAIKLAKVMTDASIDFEFVDEMSASPLIGKKVHQACNIPNVSAEFIIAISHVEHAQRAIDRLCFSGVNRANILALYYESAANVLEFMLKKDRQKCLYLIENQGGDFKKIEKLFFDNDYKNLYTFEKYCKKIGFYYIGKGGGFRSHVLGLPKELSETFVVKEFSDQPPHPTALKSYHVMSEQSMLESTWPDLVINPHFFECSPAHIPKLTMMHMVYDFLVYKDLVARVMAQPQTHYLFIPSRPSMELHQKICRDYNLQNNVVLIPGGYPRLDNSIARLDDSKLSDKKSEFIIYAPTLSALMTSSETKYTYSIFDAVEFIPAILAAFPDKQIIFRPHPDDLSVIKQGIVTKRANAFRQLLKLCDLEPRCHLDSNQSDYISTFSKARVLITDTSAIAYSFALTTKRPVIFYSADQEKVKQLMPDVAYIKDREKIGYCVDSIEQLINTLTNCFNEDNDIEKIEFCEQVVYHRGSSMQYLIDNIEYILTGKKHPDWWYWLDNC
ncbi:CDP-glycerol glycerophosphotransferase family protein [Shewanella sp. HL-SH4]|uniref:CDP-glycerol glycerophosphotransferase family protein n=1 Tax=Shewanella sp. HL-SH4 TaxID=3436240 RepID=UPI003EBA8855